MTNMLIVKTEANDQGQHLLEEQSHRESVWLDGYIAVPELLRDRMMACRGYCDLVIKDGELVDLMEHAVPGKKEAKIAELGEACQDAIYKGIDVETTSGVEHYSLTINDQTNIGNLLLQAQAGAPVLYHADGQLCRLFSPEEMMAVAAAAIRHKTYHTTLCNHLNVWVRRTEDDTELDAIAYDSPLPDDLAAHMAALLGGGDDDD